MAGIFRSGQLVGVNPLTNPVGKVDLYSVPGGSDDVRVIGSLKPTDVALVISSYRGGSSVYVVGPHGGGWAFGAFLKVIQAA